MFNLNVLSKVLAVKMGCSFMFWFAYCHCTNLVWVEFKCVYFSYSYGSFIYLQVLF